MRNVCLIPENPVGGVPGGATVYWLLELRLHLLQVLGSLLELYCKVYLL